MSENTSLRGTYIKCMILFDFTTYVSNEAKHVI